MSGGACGATTGTVSYGYDAFTAGSNRGKGQRTSMSDSSGSTTWTYGDARGRLTRESKTITGGGTFVTQWSYDSADQVTSLTYPDNEVVSYTYLPQRLVNSVVGSATYVQASLYDGAGRLTERRLGVDQLRTSYTYYAWSSDGGRLQFLKTGTPGTYNGSNPSLQYFQYDYDHVGNVSWVRDHKATGAAQTHQFTYDELDRVRTASATNAIGGTDGGLYSESYSYFANGRMQNGPLGSGYAYNDANHLHAVTAVGSHLFAYDANGNMTSRTVNGQGFNLFYDAENRLVTVNGPTSGTFVYDGDGVRVKGTVGGVTSYYVGQHYEVAGGVVKKYYYAGDTRVALRENGALRWLLGDHLGSTAYTVNGTAETGEVRYRAFGATRFTSGATPTTFRYTGQREEAGLGLYYYGARWYDPALGHFIQPDTIIPEPGNVLDYHRYAYVRYNPLKYSDPTGHNPACMAATLPPLVLGCELADVVMRYGPMAVQLASQWADKVPALWDRMFNSSSAAEQASHSASQNAGNSSTGDPNGLDPNKFDPWKYTRSNYRTEYSNYYNINRDSTNYAVHHILPQKFQDIMTKAGVNVHDPRWLREVQVKDLQTNTLIHQTKYTDVWERWSATLGRSPTAVEIVNKAQEIERAYAAHGGYYRQGANLPGSIDWVTLLKLLEKVK